MNLLRAQNAGGPENQAESTSGYGAGNLMSTDNHPSFRLPSRSRRQPDNEKEFSFSFLVLHFVQCTGEIRKCFDFFCFFSNFSLYPRGTRTCTEFPLSPPASQPSSSQKVCKERLCFALSLQSLHFSNLFHVESESRRARRKSEQHWKSIFGVLSRRK